MRRIFTTLLFVFLSSILFANPVSKEEAQKIAEKVYAHYSFGKISDFSVIDIYENKYNEKTSYYTFSFKPHGFVMISADDAAFPVLGYSIKNNATKEITNPTIKSWFNKYNKEIEESIKSKNKSALQMWDNIRNNNFPKNSKVVEYLLTTEWNQSPGYNDYAPTGNPIGCVATATSQIMNYHEWPAQGQGWHQYTPTDNPQYGMQYADFTDTYDWANMPDKLSESSTSTEVDAVATLCYNVAVSVDMNFDPSGSGAQSQDVMLALASYFKYDKSSLQYIKFDTTDVAGWLTQIKNEIDNGRPVYYDGGSESSGGHAFICDGYNASDELHMNWGWGGAYNGYFLATDMTPGSASFNEYNYAIIGIKPATTEQDILWTKQTSSFEGDTKGVQYISAVNNRVAWAVAYDGAGGSAKLKDYTRTINGGATWQAGTINAENTTNYAASMICAINEDTAWVPLFGPSGGGKIVRTTDGGTTWEHQASAEFSSPNGFPNVIHFWDANNGFCQGDPNGGYFELYTTNDGGDNWTRVPEANIPPNQSGEYGTVGYYAVYGDIIWYATNKGRIYKSIDKGLNWVVFDTPITDASFELSFKNENIGIIQSRGEGAKTSYITNDGGETWTDLNPTGNFYEASFAFVPGADLLISTGSDYSTPMMGVSYSTDNGATFTEYAELYKSHQFTALGTAGENAIWAGSFSSGPYDGGMWHYGNIASTADFSVNESRFCVNDESVIISDESTGFPDSWNWNFGEGASPATATGQGPHTIMYTTSGEKDISLTITKGTDDNEIIHKNIVAINGSVPNDAETIAGETNVYLTQSYTYSVAPQENVSFIWDIPPVWSGNNSETDTISITFGGSSYTGTISVTPQNACGDGASSSLEITASRSTGFNKIENDNSFSVYPNPAKEFINISDIGNSEIYIYNSQGTLIKYFNLIEQSPINISDLKNGIYILKASNNKEEYTKTFSVIK